MTSIRFPQGAGRRARLQRVLLVFVAVSVIAGAIHQGCNPDHTYYATIPEDEVPADTVPVTVTAAPEPFQPGTDATVELLATYPAGEDVPLDFAWQQTGGPAVPLQEHDATRASLDVRALTAGAALTIEVALTGTRAGKVYLGKVSVRGLAAPPPPPPPVLEVSPPLVLSQEADEVEGGAAPGAQAAKGRMVMLVKTAGGARDGRLVAVYADAQGGHDVWELDGGAHPARDVFSRTSDDGGRTWSNPINISRMAGLFSARTDWDGDGEPEEFWGDAGKPTIFAVADQVVVTWTSRYCPDESWAFGDTGESALQGSSAYDDAAVAAGRRVVPFAGLWAAVSTDGGTTWKHGQTSPPVQITRGRRDAIQDVSRGAGKRWAITWQEDPLGLQPGHAEGHGDGASGANTSPGTDIWYTWTSDIAAVATALVANRTPLSNQSRYDTTQADSPLVGAPGAVEPHGASRANLHLVPEGTTVKALVAYEESKDVGTTSGKTVQYHAFVFDAPAKAGTAEQRSGDPGTLISPPAESARRVRFVRQPADGVVPALAIFWRQGTGDHGDPADIVFKASTSFDAAAVASATALNLSSNTPTAGAANLTDRTDLNPLEDARAHRAIMRGNFIAVGWSYVSDGLLEQTTDQVNWNFWVRRSFDGGVTWDAPRNVSQVTDTRQNVFEPRLVQPADTGTQNDDAFVVAWATETNVPVPADPAPLEVWLSRTVDRGETYETPLQVSGSAPRDYETQLAVRADGREIYMVWTSEGEEADIVFARAAEPVTPE